MVSRLEEIWLVGLFGGALIANFLWGPTTIVLGGFFGFLILWMCYKKRWI